MLKRDPKTNEFDLGPSIIKYARQSLKQLDIKKIAQPHLENVTKHDDRNGSSRRH